MLQPNDDDEDDDELSGLGQKNVDVVQHKDFDVNHMVRRTSSVDSVVFALPATASTRSIACNSAAAGQADDGFCAQPGHQHFELSMKCETCSVYYCMRCFSKHVGHKVVDAAAAKLSEQMTAFKRTSSAPEAVPKDTFISSAKAQAQASHKNDEFASVLAAFRRTEFAEKIERRMKKAQKFVDTESTLIRATLSAMDDTISKTAKLLEESARLIASWFNGLRGKALADRIEESFRMFDTDGGGTLDIGEYNVQSIDDLSYLAPLLVLCVYVCVCSVYVCVYVSMTRVHACVL
jgi:hypothetical protein